MMMMVIKNTKLIDLMEMIELREELDEDRGNYLMWEQISLPEDCSWILR